MFTIKMYDGNKTRILEAESFTIHYSSQGECGPHGGSSREWAEVTLHNRDSDVRYDLGDSPMRDSISGEITCYQKAYIENSAGKTIEHINYGFPPRAGVIGKAA